MEADAKTSAKRWRCKLFGHTPVVTQLIEPGATYEQIDINRCANCDWVAPEADTIAARQALAEWEQSDQFKAIMADWAAKEKELLAAGGPVNPSVADPSPKP